MDWSQLRAYQSFQQEKEEEAREVMTSHSKGLNQVEGFVVVEGGM